jgi:hypothetical protein
MTYVFLLSFPGEASATWERGVYHTRYRCETLDEEFVKAYKIFKDFIRENKPSASSANPSIGDIE